jgi:drug/metabolite transporter (DMT)-like permease
MGKNFFRNQSMNYQRLIAYLFLILAPVTVGINIVGTKYLIASFPIFFILAVRFLLASALLLPLHWATKHGRSCSMYRHLNQLTKKDWLFLLGQALSAGILFNLPMIFGLKYTNANTAGIITSGLPAIIAIMSWIVLKEAFTPKKAACVGFATMGLVIISCGHADTNFESSFLGNSLVFLALLPEASYYVLTKLHSCHLPIFLTSAILNGINAVILLPIVFYYVDAHGSQLFSYNGFILLVVGISTGLFYIFWYLGSKAVDAVMGALSTAIMPIATVTIAWLTLGETIGVTQWLGMGFVVFSIVAYALPSRKT